MVRGNQKKLKTAFKSHMAGIQLTSDGTVKDGCSGKSDDTSKILDADGMPKKRFFRTRAHCNPLSHNDGFSYPENPSKHDWGTHYTEAAMQKDNGLVRHLDIGMGFGGLSVALAKLYPDKLNLGMEIRAKVCEYVRLRVNALRNENENTGDYGNVSCLRTNCMRYLPNYFEKGQIEKIFFCFPDPHFKAKNHRRRIVSENLLSEYAYILAPGGILYTITDVEELHNWHVEKCTAHPGFERLPDDEVFKNDPSVKAMIEETEEGHKVARNNGKKFFAVFRKTKKSTNKIDELWAK